MAFRETVVETKPVSQPDKYVPKYDKPISGLPSGGKPYPKTLEIKYRPYTFGEVKTVNQTGRSNFSTKDRINQILDGVKVSEGFDIQDLTLQDVLFLGFLRKRSTFVKQDKVSIAHFCEGCKRATEFLLSENEQLDFNEIKAPALPVSFEMHGEEFQFSPITVKNYFNYIDLAIAGIDQNKEYDPASAIMAAQCISHSFEDAYKAIFNANPQESKLLDEIDVLLNHDIKPIKFNCRNKKGDQICNHESLIKLDEVDRLVLPFRGEHEELTSSSLNFGSRPRIKHK